MDHPTREEQRQLVRQWEETGRELACIRKEKLRDMPYNWRDVDALLELGDSCGHVSRESSGLVEMQRQFMALRQRMK